jgi:hypothetical protein
VAHSQAEVAWWDKTKTFFQDCQIDHIFAIVVEQRAQRPIIAALLIAIPQVQRIASVHPLCCTLDAQTFLDSLETAAQTTSPTDIHEIAMPEVTSEIDKEAPANDRQIEPGTVECHECFHTLEHIVQRRITHSAAD